MQPPPDILPKDKWEFVTTWMGNFLGHGNTRGPYSNLIRPDQIPPEPLISKDELELIQRFYTTSAPEASPPQENKPRLRRDLELFKSSPARLLSAGSLITLVKIDPQNKRLFVGDGDNRQLLVFGENGGLKERHKVGSQPISLTLDGRNFYLTLIGDLDRDRGKGQVIYYNRSGNNYSLQNLVPHYYRIAHAAHHDINLDGRRDIIISAFGDYRYGRFSWFENQERGRLEEHILIERSGALKSAVHDFNRDGLPDLMVLMAQGRNELLLFINKGEGRFEQKQVFEKFPGFGFNDFHLADFNSDGLMDLITVNGNNMEIPDPPLRNYHGVRLYENTGRMDFKESFFYPMFGAIRAVSADFDQDGDLDIAAVSYFPDWSADCPETFVFLANQGHYEFTPYTLEESCWGRWLTLDAGDLDGDGDQDLVLGNGFNLSGIPERFQSEFIRKSRKTQSVLILKNNLSEGVNRWITSTSRKNASLPNPSSECRKPS